MTSADLSICRCGSCTQEPPVLRYHPDKFCGELGARRPRRRSVSHRLDKEGRQQLPICELQTFVHIYQRSVRRKILWTGNSKTSPAVLATTWQKQTVLLESKCYRSDPTSVSVWGKCQLLPSGFQHAVFCFPHQAILNNDETTYPLENLEPDTPYDVSVTAIYPDESESEDLLGTEKTCKTRNYQQYLKLYRVDFQLDSDQM